VAETVVIAQITVALRWLGNETFFGVSKLDLQAPK
jgi:hypothetical protein